MRDRYNGDANTYYEKVLKPTYEKRQSRTLVIYDSEQDVVAKAKLIAHQIEQKSLFLGVRASASGEPFTHPRNDKSALAIFLERFKGLGMSKEDQVDWVTTNDKRIRNLNYIVGQAAMKPTKGPWYFDLPWVEDRPAKKKKQA